MVAVVNETVPLNSELPNEADEYHLTVLVPTAVEAKLATVALFAEQKLCALDAVGAAGVVTTFTTTALRALSQVPSVWAI